ncbi:hypothetical protein SEA_CHARGERPOWER_43 [Mycobacterium phage Chargerpower]|nr:hypothetical protein SEA_CHARGERPOWER_43 [Mycobacterium phage Chargerpower]
MSGLQNTMGLTWHGEGDMVETTAFRPSDLKLILDLGDGGTYDIHRTATPEIFADPEYLRREVHLLIDRLVDLLKDRQVI